MLLSKEDVTAATELISKANVVVCQLEIPVETTRHALTIARQHNGGLIFLCSYGIAFM